MDGPCETPLAALAKFLRVVTPPLHPQVWLASRRPSPRSTACRCCGRWGSTRTSSPAAAPSRWRRACAPSWWVQGGGDAGCRVQGGRRMGSRGREVRESQRVGKLNAGMKERRGRSYGGGSMAGGGWRRAGGCGGKGARMDGALGMPKARGWEQKWSERTTQAAVVDAWKCCG